MNPAAYIYFDDPVCSHSVFSQSQGRRGGRQLILHSSQCAAVWVGTKAHIIAALKKCLFQAKAGSIARWESQRGSPEQSEVSSPPVEDTACNCGILVA